MLKRVAGASVVSLLLVFLACAQAPDPAVEVELETLTDKVSYIAGYNLGDNFEGQEFEANVDAVMLGIEEAMAGTESRFTPEESREIAITFQTEQDERLRRRDEAEAAANLEAGQTFLAENGRREGVQTTASGLQYEVLAAGDGATPDLESAVRAHYLGTLVDGTVFDSSYERGVPARFDLRGVIAGWSEALQMMPVGSKWKLYVPPDLGYGAERRGQIPPNSTLIFEVELLEIEN